jgi:hypothetical protein
MRTFAPGTGGEMKAQSVQSRFIQMLEVELSFANNQLVEAREDIEFYRAKVERLELTRVWSKFSSCPLPHARTSLQTQVHDKSGSVDPLLGPDRKHPYLYVRLPDTTRCPYLYAYAYAASRS